MHQKKQIAALVALFVLAASIAGCGQKPTVYSSSDGGRLAAAASIDISSEEAVETTVSFIQPSPETALEKIYEAIEISGVRSADTFHVEDLLGVEQDDIESAYIRYTSGDFGLSDVFILLPEKEQKDAVREALYLYKNKRIQEFQQFDILGASEIAQNASIFDHGDYLVLLMLEDNDSAREIIQQYVPS